MDHPDGWVERALRIGADPRTVPALGALLAAAAVSESGARAAVSGDSALVGLVLGSLALATTAPLAVLSVPAAAVSITLASALSVAPFHSLTIAGCGAQLVALYRLGRDGRQLLAAVFSVPFLAMALAGIAGETGVLAVLLAALAPAAAWAGATVRGRRSARAHDVAREVALGALLENTARGERARIVRELHDIVAHHVSMIAVQAETARLATPGMPTAGAQRLSSIGDTARAALTEMRRLLGVLREDTATDAPERQPQPGLRQLNELLDEMRAAGGTGARLIVRGPPDILDPGVELAAYRIVQEALTNTRRHAPGAAVDVELHYTDEALHLRIRDNGPGPPSAGSAAGHGLLGMRERATAVGGRLTTGAAAGGGFLVESVLPVKSEDGA